MDIWSKEKRSAVMAKIRSKNTKPERILRSALHKQGYRFRIHKNDLPGKPDIVFPTKRIAIYVHGCFWHFHKDCPEGKIPKSNSKFWIDKLNRNIIRDKTYIAEIEKAGWKTFVIWECDIENRLEVVLNRLNKHLKKA
jgi:DNA mismatch endonuclease, patch repair protein